MRILENKAVVFLTKHGKEQVVRPLMERETGCRLITENRFDTDRLGTFTRDVRRVGTPMETARKKIRIGLDLTDSDGAVASEGSFGSHPYAPIPWNTEIVLYADRQTGLEVYGLYEGGDTNYGHLATADYSVALQFARTIGFPEHRVILRPDDETSPNLIRDIHTPDGLKEAFQWCAGKSANGTVFLETDMRAYANPTRMKNIERATADLVTKLTRLCPQCGAYGFVVGEIVRGLPCETCGLPSEMTLKYVYSCHSCGHTQDELHPKGSFCPAKYCQYCNP